MRVSASDRKPDLLLMAEKVNRTDSSEAQIR